MMVLTDEVQAVGNDDGGRTKVVHDCVDYIL